MLCSLSASDRQMPNGVRSGEERCECAVLNGWIGETCTQEAPGEEVRKKEEKAPGAKPEDDYSILAAANFFWRSAFSRSDLRS